MARRPWCAAPIALRARGGPAGGRGHTCKVGRRRRARKCKQPLADTFGPAGGARDSSGSSAQLGARALDAAERQQLSSNNYRQRELMDSQAEPGWLGAGPLCATVLKCKFLSGPREPWRADMMILAKWWRWSSSCFNESLALARPASARTLNTYFMRPTRAREAPKMGVPAGRRPTGPDQRRAFGAPLIRGRPRASGGRGRELLFTAKNMTIERFCASAQLQCGFAVKLVAAAS